MKPGDFLKDKGILLLLHLVCMCSAAVFFRLTGYSETNTILFITVWLLLLTVWLSVTFTQRRRFFREAGQILEKIDQRYLLGELLPDSFRLEDRLYREMIRRSNKSCIEQVRQIEKERNDYKEYMESWVHEIKAPITGISLLCNNRRRVTSTENRQQNTADTMPAAYEVPSDLQTDYLTISLEIQKIENYVDMVLYYARSEDVYKDYFIRETSLEDVVCEALDKNHLTLIQNKVQVNVNCEATVYTDRKWIVFILNQMILNCIKYRSENPLLHIHTRREENCVLLLVEDNGVGIRPEELSRIFDKGFTGSNGRDNRRATGIGLYLCKTLCRKLGIGLSAESEYGTGTRLCLEFPVSNYILPHILTKS